LGLTGIGRERGNSGEFPILGKHYFHEKCSWRPFVGAGVALRTIGFTDLVSVVNSSTPAVTTNFRSNLETSATFPAGVKVQKGRIAIIPEFRYTRWGKENYELVRNDARFLLGISFQESSFEETLVSVRICKREGCFIKGHSVGPAAEPHRETGLGRRQ
jgi:hypothetical protein